MTKRVLAIVDLAHQDGEAGRVPADKRKEGKALLL
jgi:hypothetical protein